MFEIFKKEVKLNDNIKLYLTSGKEVIVNILEIGEKYILVKNVDGTQSRFFEPLIGGWDLLNNYDQVQLEKDVSENIITNREETSNNLIEEKHQNTVYDIKENDLVSRLPEKKIGLTIVGNIDLDKIEKKKKNKSQIQNVDVIENKDLEKQEKQEEPKNLVQHLKEHNLVLKSFQGLQELKDRINFDNSKIIVPANVTMKKYLHNYKYGYVTDNQGVDYKFYLNDILDENLYEQLKSNITTPLHMVCSLKFNDGKNRATTLLLPKSIEDLQVLAKKLFIEKELIESLLVLNILLNVIDDYLPALELKNQIFIEQNKKRISSTNASSIFLQAKKEFKKGNSEYAKKLLLQIIETPNFKSETALKELSYELQREGKIDESIELILKYSDLIKTSDPNSLLAYFFETKKDYKTAISYLEKIKPQTPLEKIKVDKRLAIDFFQIKDYISSELYLRKVIEKQPNEITNQKLLDALEKIKLEGLSDEIETIFNEAELSSLTGGRSPYISFAMSNCDYAGVPANIASEENFTKTTLKELRRLVDEAGKARPKERAPYLLTEAKLMELLEPEKEDELRSVLSRYCLAISQNTSSENSSVDVVRFYLLEAFKLTLTYNTISGFVPIYLHSFQLSSFESNKMNSKGMDETLKDIFNKEVNIVFWIGIIDLFITNTEIFSQLLTRLFQNQLYKKSCIKFLTLYNDLSNIEIFDKESFSTLWNQAVEKRRREKEIFNSKFTSTGKSKSTEAFTEAFYSAINIIPDWISILDKYRINSINDILKTVFDFNTQLAYEDKERYFNIVGSQINALQSEIENNPTEFSFNILRSQLGYLNKIIENEFRLVIQTSRPSIKINILGESIIHDNNVVTSSFNVSNKKGSAPISWFKININNSNGINFINENNEYHQSLKGGDDKTLKLKIQVSKEIRDQGAFNLNLSLSYKIRGSDQVTTFIDNLAVRLYSEDEFDEINNPFVATADSGPVLDEKMFYGRSEFIENIKNSVLGSSSKCIIIYGQKRSGKSSVLFHLKKHLNQSSQAFCISFSLGEIVEDLSAQTFYYKILSEIEDSLDILKNSNLEIPIFKAPTLTELKEAPSLVFNDFMKKFKKECSLTVGWEDKNLVLLIDEFTYIYTAIQKKFLSEQFMKTWKSLVEKSFFTSILIGQDIMPKFKMEYQNEFGIAEDKRLSYLSKNDAIKLIEEPIWDHKRNRSRYLGSATDLIIDYTSSNPYYIQIFCARLVEYMNNQKSISITEADVYDVAQTFIIGEQSLSADKFDNLITAGDADIEAFNPKDILKALSEIAFASKNLDSCSRDSIKLGDREKEEQILSDLKTREVISCPQPDYYKIKVRLFKEWLVNN